MEKKVCNKCNEEKEVSEFYFRKNRERYDPTCRECVRIAAKERYNSNPDKQKIASQKYRKNNPIKVKKSNRISGKKHYKNNKEKCLNANKQWRKDNPNWQIEYEKKKRKTDINYKVTCNLRSRMSMAVKHQLGIKESTKKLLGCDINFLRKHLEGTFTDDMSWDNYGEWHIDHIIPCTKFDLTDKEEQKKCFHYSNLQALWALDNISKGNKIIKQIKK